MRSSLLAALILGSALPLVIGCARCRPCCPTPVHAPPGYPPTRAAEVASAPVEPDIEGPAYVIEAELRSVGRRAPTTMKAPRIATRPGERAEVSVLNQVSYVQEFDVELANGGYIADPIIGIIQDGLTLELVATPHLGAPDSTLLGFEATVADLREPIRTHAVRFSAKGPPGTVQLPVIDLARAAGVRVVPLGTRTLLTTVPAPDGWGTLEIYVRIATVGDVSTHQDVADEKAAAPEPDDAQALGLPSMRKQVDLAAMLEQARIDPASPRDVRLRFIRTNAPLPPDEPIALAAAQALLRGMRAQTIQRLELSSTVVGTTASSLRQTAYVQDYDVAVAGSDPEPPGEKTTPAAAAYDPVIGTLLSGCIARVEAADMGVALHLAWAEPVRPMPRFTTTMEKGGGQVSIELPELRVLNKHLPLPPGRWLVPLGKTIAKTRGGDAVWYLAVWIDS